MTCKSPIRVFKYAPAEGGLLVPCGKCTPCRIQRANEWSIRCEHEMEDWEHKSFITLTYDDENLPDGNNVSPRDLQLFLKRLRKRLGHPCKFLAAGEYGENKAGVTGPSQLTERPHYHILLFGYDRRWQFRGDDKLNGHPNFKWNGKSWDIIHGPIRDCWDKGIAYLASASASSARYIAGYTLKSNVKKLGDFHHDGRRAAFFRVSRGLGYRYCMRNADRLTQTLSLRRNGKEIGIPRQYQVWLGIPTEQKAERALKLKKEQEERWAKKNKLNDNTLDWQLAEAREKSNQLEKWREMRQ